MSQEKDYLGKVKEERTLTEKIIGYIPGYRGYKDKELRRESDRLVRMDVVNRLKDAKMIFRRHFADPIVIKKLGSNSYQFDALTLRLDRITQRIDRAVAGYAGTFNAVKVKEDKLEAVIQHDVGMIEKAESIKASIEKVITVEAGSEDWKKLMDTSISNIEQLDRLIDERTNLLKGLQ